MKGMLVSKEQANCGSPNLLKNQPVDIIWNVLFLMKWDIVPITTEDYGIPDLRIRKKIQLTTMRMGIIRMSKR